MKGFIQCSHWSDTTAGRKDAIESHSGIFCQLMCSNSKLEEKKKKNHIQRSISMYQSQK